ncbi:MAG: sodium-translocating pyrophosphatase [Actinobacteria bacterium]|nr:sodium-translocating pyrophosphatase [Actinomycetota bacterium]
MRAASSLVHVTGNNINIVYIVLAISLGALAVAWALRAQVLAADEGTEKMREIAGAVQEGAAAYLARQFRTLSYFVAIVFLLLFALPGATDIRIGRSIFFLLGAGFSALVGYNGMWLAVRANVRVAEAARQNSSERAVQIAFRTGGVVGMTTVGLGLVGASLVVIIYRENAPSVLEGFGFGAAMLAMFMRVGGGIFTKAADVGADLVGKVEKNIPEDDPRNAATIADNVGDNVGDCAGMAADLFESYAVTLVAALILGKAGFGDSGLIFPLIIPAIGTVTAVLGIFLTKVRKSDATAMNAINRSFFLSAVISAVLSGLATYVYLPSDFKLLTGLSPEAVAAAGNTNPRVLALGAVLIGIVLAAAIQVLTGFFTATGKRPVNDVAASSQTGAATVLLSGISIGFESAVYSAILIATAVFGAFLLGGGSIVLSLLAIALAGTGLLTTVGVIVAMDTFGPISDNAQGIAEMSGDVHGEGSKILTSLDAVGNTTKAITKGIAIATAVLAATALFGAFTDAIRKAVEDAGKVARDLAWQYQGILDVANPRNLVGLIIGAAVVFLFSGLAINAVSRAAGAVVVEVRKQFIEHPGIMAGTEKPEYGRVVDICTRDSLRELATPGLLAVMAPIAVAYLAGAIGTGTLMAVFLANSGGAWDNAKKMVEDGHYGGKGSDAHAATIIGDTVGDPFKDTAGPAINPLIKVMNLVGLLITPAIVSMALGGHTAISTVIGLFAFAVIIGALIHNRRKSTAIEY